MGREGAGSDLLSRASPWAARGGMSRHPHSCARREENKEHDETVIQFKHIEVPFTTGSQQVPPSELQHLDPLTYTSSVHISSIRQPLLF